MHDMMKWYQTIVKNLSQTEIMKDQMSTSMNQYLGGMCTTYLVQTRCLSFDPGSPSNDKT